MFYSCWSSTLRFCWNCFEFLIYKKQEARRVRRYTDFVNSNKFGRILFVCRLEFGADEYSEFIIGTSFDAGRIRILLWNDLTCCGGVL